MLRAAEHAAPRAHHPRHGDARRGNETGCEASQRELRRSSPGQGCRHRNRVTQGNGRPGVRGNHDLRIRIRTQIASWIASRVKKVTFNPGPSSVRFCRWTSSFRGCSQSTHLNRERSRPLLTSVNYTTSIGAPPKNTDRRIPRPVHDQRHTCPGPGCPCRARLACHCPLRSLSGAFHAPPRGEPSSSGEHPLSLSCSFQRKI